MTASPIQQSRLVCSSCRWFPPLVLPAAAVGLFPPPVPAAAVQLLRLRRRPLHDARPRAPLHLDCDSAERLVHRRPVRALRQAECVVRARACVACACVARACVACVVCRALCAVRCVPCVVCRACVACACVVCAVRVVCHMGRVPCGRTVVFLLLFFAFRVALAVVLIQQRRGKRRQWLPLGGVRNLCNTQNGGRGQTFAILALRTGG